MLISSLSDQLIEPCQQFKTPGLWKKSEKLLLVFRMENIEREVTLTDGRFRQTFSLEWELQPTEEEAPSGICSGGRKRSGVKNGLCVLI